jgi:hypothetical protein
MAAKKIAYHSLVVNVDTGVGTQVEITVYDAGTLDSATIYSDSSGTGKSNPFNTDADGRFSFYADPGEYDIKASGAGITDYTLSDVSIIGEDSQFVKSSPGAGEYRLKGLRIDSDGQSIVVTHASSAES